jgi:hypothetical protein
LRKESEPVKVDFNDHHSEASQGFWQAWRWWALPALLAALLATIFIDPFIGDWDGLDYTVLSLRGQPSSMALGRTLFIFTNHAAWRISHELFGLQAENAYLLFKYMVVAQSSLAVVACWVLARDLTRSSRAATIAALLVTVSPAYVVYSGQVMTEIPSILVLVLGLVAYLRGVRSRRLWLMLLGAAVLGAGANLRETVAFYGLWLIVAPISCGWKVRWREIVRVALSGLVFVVFTFGIFAFWFLTDLNNFRASWFGWLATMRVEEARHPVTLYNIVPWLKFFFMNAPLVFVVLPFAFIKELRRARGFSPLLALAFTGLCANLLLLFNYSTTINWRYLLTGLPALAPLAAAFYLSAFTAWTGSAKRAYTSVLLLIASVTLVFAIFTRPVSREFVRKRALTKDYHARLAHVPRDAVMISGSQTVAVTYWRGIGLGHWDVIGTGSGWPGQALSSTIEKFLSENRRVFLDVDPRWWSPCGWQEAETRELVAIESEFRFRRVDATLYEIRPRTEEEAHDVPDLKSLLPENRPAEVERCTG